MASPVLPIVPWRNEFIRTIWLVQGGVEGDLVVSGRRLDADGIARFIRQGGEGVNEELRVGSAGSPRVGRTPDETRPYGEHAVFLVLPGPGCWELTARIGDIRRTMRLYVYA
jgi:hypothetical protein